MRPLALLILAAAALAESLGPPTPYQVVALPVPAPAAPTKPAPAAAPDPFAAFPRADGPLTRAGAVKLALQHSPVLTAARSDVQLAAAMLSAARARLQPALSLSTFATYTDSEMIINSPPGLMPASTSHAPAGQALTANLMFMLPLYTGGRLEQQAASQRDAQRASEAELAGARLEVAFTVSELYRRIVLQQATVDVYRELVATAKERLRVTQALSDTGKLPAFNVLRDQAALAEARQTQTNAERDARTLLAELKAALGVHPLSEVQVSEKLAEETYDLAREPALLAAARQRPDLAAVRARLAAAAHDEKAAAAAFRPEVNLLGMGTLEANRMPRNEEYLVGLGVSLPLLDGGMRRAEVRRARAAKEGLSAQERERLLRAGQEVVAADERRAAAKQNLATAEEALKSAREDYRIAQDRYAAGKGINVEVLDALAAQVRAETNFLAALYELGTAQDELRRATGDMGLLDR